MAEPMVPLSEARAPRTLSAAELRRHHGMFEAFLGLVTLLQDQQMEGLARHAHDYGLGWKEAWNEDLVETLDEHVAKLKASLESGAKVQVVRDAADVANIVAMIADERNPRPKHRGR